MNKAELVKVRDFLPADRNFIFASWLRGLYYGCDWFRETNKDTFMHHYHKVVEYVLSSPDTDVKVACLAEDPDVILGYAVLGHNATTLHWVFVKTAWRSIGLAKMLVPTEQIRITTHLSKPGLSLRKKFPGVEFNPFAI